MRLEIEGRDTLPAGKKLGTHAVCTSAANSRNPGQILKFIYNGSMDHWGMLSPTIKKICLGLAMRAPFATRLKACNGLSKVCQSRHGIRWFTSSTSSSSDFICAAVNGVLRTNLRASKSSMVAFAKKISSLTIVGTTSHSGLLRWFKVPP